VLAQTNQTEEAQVGGLCKYCILESAKQVPTYGKGQQMLLRSLALKFAALLLQQVVD